MAFVVVGTNHKYSPIELREKISFSKKRLGDALCFLKEGNVLEGAVILSTCNRVEIYSHVEDLEAGIREIENFIFQYHEINKQSFSSYLYIYEGEEAIRHLFSVACGLDSLILGETQILGQVKFSFLEAENVGFVDGFLREIFYRCFSLARRVHRDAKISDGKVSIGSIAIDFIRERFSSLLGKNILIIGVGKVTELVLKYLKKEEPNVVFISNRTFQKAQELACAIGAKAVKFDELKNYLPRADVIITATGSPHFILKREILQKITNYSLSANHFKLLILDLALPRDVDPGVGEMENVDLFGLEDLNTVIEKNMEKKNQEAKKAREIIDKEVERLWVKLIKSEQEPALLL